MEQAHLIRLEMEITEDCQLALLTRTADRHSRQLQNSVGYVVNSVKATQQKSQGLL